MTKIKLEAILLEANPIRTAAEEENKQDWAKEYDSTVDKTAILDEFLVAFETKYNIKLNDNLKTTIKKHIQEVGSSTLDFFTNPFLQFLVNYNKAGLDTSQFLGVDYDNLHLLYGEHVISDKNLTATGPQGLNDIIFVEDLFKNDYASIKYLCQAFYWLHNLANIKNLKLENLTKEDYSWFLGYLNGIRNSAGQFTSTTPDININTFADLVMFIDKVYSHTGKLNKADNITKALDYLDSTQNNRGVKQDTDTDLDAARKPFTGDATSMKTLDLSNLDKNKALDVIRFLRSKYGITL